MTTQTLLDRWPSLLAITMAIVFPLILPKGMWVTSLALISGVLAYPISGMIRRQLRGRSVIAVQATAFFGFVGLALVALLVDPEVGRYLLIAGWLGHAVWDFMHHRADLIVPRWLSEFCALIDVLTAMSLILAPLWRTV